MSSVRLVVVVGKVKQGRVISPLLFTVYTDALIDTVLRSKVGCHIRNKNASIFVYADDIILLSPTRSAMQTLLGTCESFITTSNIIISITNTTVESPHKKGTTSNIIIITKMTVESSQ